MNKKEAFQKGADAVAQPTAERLDEIAQVQEASATKKDVQEFTDITISNFEEINYRSIGLSKLTTLKDLSEDADVSIVLHLVDRYCNEDEFVKNSAVNDFLYSLHSIERNITIDGGMDYSAIDNAEDSPECSKLLFLAVCICNELTEGKYSKKAYDEIINNITLKKTELESLPTTIKDKISIYPVKKWAYLLTGYDFDTEVKLREEELENKRLAQQLEFLEQQQKLEETQKAQEAKETEIREREKQLEDDAWQQGKLPLIREAVRVLVLKENDYGKYSFFLDGKNLSEKVRKKLANKIGKGNTPPENILAFYSGNIFANVNADQDIFVFLTKWNGLIITDSLLCYKEAGTIAKSQNMSYKNIIGVKKSGLFVVIQGKDGSKMKIRRHISLNSDVLISFVNEIIRIERNEK